MITETLDFKVQVIDIEEHSSPLVGSFVMNIRGRPVVADEFTLKESLFPSDELKKNYKTLEHMPLNINHEQDKIVGCITKAQYVFKDNKKPEVWIDGVVWEYLNPQVGSVIREAASKDELYLSTEVYTQKVVCPECGKVLDYLLWRAGVDLCDHWRESNKRIFKDFLFLGCAILVPPMKPAVKKAYAELLKFDFSIVTLDNLKRLSDEELLRLHDELHREFNKLYGKSS